RGLGGVSGASPAPTRFRQTGQFQRRPIPSSYPPGTSEPDETGTSRGRDSVGGLRLARELGAHQLAFREEPVIEIASVRASARHKQLVRTPGNLLGCDSHHLLRAGERLLDHRSYPDIGGCCVGGSAHIVPLLWFARVTPARADGLTTIGRVVIFEEA